MRGHGSAGTVPAPLTLASLPPAPTASARPPACLSHTPANPPACLLDVDPRVAQDRVPLPRLGVPRHRESSPPLQRAAGCWLPPLVPPAAAWARSRSAFWRIFNSRSALQQWHHLEYTLFVRALQIAAAIVSVAVENEGSRGWTSFTLLVSE